MTKSKSILMMDVMVDAIKELEGRTKALESTERNVLAELRAQEITLGIVSKKVLKVAEALLEVDKNLSRLVGLVDGVVGRLKQHVRWPYCHKER